MTRLRHFFTATALVAVGFVVSACGDEGAEQASAPPPPPPVTVATPLQQTITRWDEFTGRFEAVEQVEVRARVSGFVDEINFKDGDFVQKGDVLFVIDPRPFEIAEDREQALVVQATAALDLAETELERARTLRARGNAPQREVDTRDANRKSAAAEVAEARARLRQARLELEWTEVKAPISGRMSDARVDVGNLITGGSASASLLSTIVALDPIHFVFQASEADFLKYSRLARSGERESSREVANPIRIKLADEDQFVHEGVMDFVDSTVDFGTGTVKGRAILDNPTYFLTPGVFGRLQLFGGDVEALLVPDDAISSDQSRKIVFVVAEDGTVGTKVVTQGPLWRGLRVITGGITLEDRVIINGLMRARPGQKVTPEDGAITPASQPAGN